MGSAGALARLMGLLRKTAIGAGILFTASAGYVGYYAASAQIEAHRGSVARGFSSPWDESNARNAGFTDPKAWAAKRSADEAKAAAAEVEREAAEKRASALNDLRIKACVQAEMEVEHRLKAPSTAKFPSCSHYDIRISSDEKTIVVVGYVDAQNSFGAMLRNRFIVKFGHLPGGIEYSDLYAPKVFISAE